MLTTETLVASGRVTPTRQHRVDPDGNQWWINAETGFLDKLRSGSDHPHVNFVGSSGSLSVWWNLMASLATPSSYREMLFAFLRAELDSPTERQRLDSALGKMHEPETSITSDNVGTETLHRIFMAYRGEERLFHGLDLRTLDWVRIELMQSDLARVLTCRDHFEDRFGTRVLSAVAVALKGSSRSSAAAIINKIRAGVQLEPPILLADPDIKRLVILEGHNRMIAYETYRSELQFPIHALLGTSAAISNWCQWS